MPHLQSSAIRFVSYDQERHILKATFRNSGRTFLYEDVPEDIYDRLLFADSIGAFFNAYIRDRYPFHEV